MVARRFGSGVRQPSRLELMQRLREMQARRQQAGGTPNRAGGPVPGLRGMHFSPDMETASRLAAQSVAQWNSPDRMNHPAIGFSRSAAGIDGLAGGSIDAIRGDVERRLAEAGIIQTPDGWTIAGAPGGGRAPNAIADRVSQMTSPASATGGTVRLGDIAPGTTTNIDVSGGVQNGRPGLGGVTTQIPGAGTVTTTPTLPASQSVIPPPKPTPGGVPPSAGQVPGTLGTGQTNASGADVIGRGTVQSETQNPATAGLSPAPPPPPGGGLQAPLKTTDQFNAQMGVSPPEDISGTTAPTYPTGQAASFQYFQDPATVPGTLGTGQTNAGNADVIGAGSNQVDPNNPATAGVAQVATPSPGLGGTPPAPTNQAPPPQQQQPAPPPAPQNVAPPPQGTPQAPGRPSTPTVAPGSLPGQSTPSRPGVTPGGPSPRPAHTGPLARPQTSNLSGLGDSIRSWVDQMVGNTQRSVGMPQGQGLAGLQGLGDRIRASVAGATGDASVPSPSGGGVGLGDMASQIMGQVRTTMPRPAPTQGAAFPPTSATPLSDTLNRPSPGVLPTSQGGVTSFGGPPAPATPTGTNWSQEAQSLGVTPATPSNQFQYFSTPTGDAAAPAQPTGAIGAPQGAIQAPLQIAFGRGGTWDAVNQYDASYVAEGQKYGVDPAMLKAMAVIESGGQMIPNQNGSGAYGIMQIKDADFGVDAARLGYDLNTPEGQIGMAAAILGGQTARTAGMTPEEAFVNVYYPTGCMDCTGEDGHTPRQYLADMNALMSEINAASPPATGPISQPGGVAPGTEGPQLGTAISQPGGLPPGAEGNALIPGSDTPIGGLEAPPRSIPGGNAGGVPGTTQPTGQLVIYNPDNPAGNQNIDPNYVPTGGLGMYGGIPNDQPKAVTTPETMSYLEALIPGASQAMLSDPNGVYGFGSNSGCAGCYDGYWGWDPNLHPGLDVASNPSAQEQFGSLVDGTVICVGSTDYGNPSTTGGCGAYPDTQHGGLTPDASGNLSILTDDGAIVTYGHTSTLDPSVQGGGRVTAGQTLGLSGSMTGPDGHHTHLEVRLPIGPNGEHILVDPNVYFNGGYCDQGFCPFNPASADPTTAGMTPASQTTPALAPTSQPAPAQPQSTAAPAAAPAAAAPLPAPSYYDQGTTTGQTYQVVTDAQGRQYEVMADGSQRLIYDPAW